MTGASAIVLSGFVAFAPVSALARFAGPASSQAGGSFDSLMADADAARSNGDVSTAMRLHLRAYQALGPADRVGLTGEIAIENALDDLDGSPAPGEDAEALAPWLQAAVDERNVAHQRGEAEPVPLRWRATLNRITPAEEPTPPEPVVEPEPEPVIDDALDDEKATPKRDAALLATGIGLTLAGAGMLGGGFSILNQVAEESTEPTWPSVAASQSDAAEAYRRDLEQWETRGRAIGTTVVVGGAILAAGGIILTTWSAVRIRHRRQQELAIHPWWNRNGGGVSVRMRLGGLTP